MSPDKTTGKRMRITKEVLWRSSTGKWAVVEGPFPHLFPRSETRDSVEKASKLRVDGVCARGVTTKGGVYAKVLAADLHEVFGGENQWGKVCP